VSLPLLFGLVLVAQDKYSVKVPGGLAFSEFRGYEAWQTISVSRNERVVAVILGNPAMIKALRGWYPPATVSPCQTGPRWPRSIGARNRTISLRKDRKRFADSGGWGYGVFDYNAASDTFTPGTTAGTPPQGNDAKCGSRATRQRSREIRFHRVREKVKRRAVTGCSEFAAPRALQKASWRTLVRK
jgi:Cytochrome P460